MQAGLLSGPENIMRQKLTLITPGVKDFERAFAFYEQGPGGKRSYKKHGTTSAFCNRWNYTSFISKKVKFYIISLY